MQVRMINYKTVAKVMLAIFAIWLFGTAIQTTFSTYVEPEDYYSSDEEYEFQESSAELEADAGIVSAFGEDIDIDALEDVEDLDESGDDQDEEVELASEENDSLEVVDFDDESDLAENDEADEDEESPLVEYRDGVYYWLSDMDEEVGIMPLWDGDQNQDDTLIISSDTNTNGFNRVGNISIREGVTLTVSGATTITGRVMVQAGATLIMNDGTINYSTVSPEVGIFGWGQSASVMVGQGATFTMNGGMVTGTGSRGVRLHGGTFNMHDGEIAGNTIAPATASLIEAVVNCRGGGIRITASNSTINMTGGSINNNTSGQGGGILYNGGFGNGHAHNRIEDVEINLSGGSITNNHAVSPEFGGGGGIDLISVRLVNGGSINNVANQLLAGSDIDLNLSGTIEISHNTSVQSGGGIRWNSMGMMRMTGGHVHNNQASFAPSAPTLAGSSGRYGGGGVSITFSLRQNRNRRVGDVSITGGIIENNTAHGHGGGVSNQMMSTLTVGGNTIIRNNESGWSGGGVQSTADGSLTITDNALITNNRTNHHGGGVSRIGSGNLIISDSVLITNNTARYDGGGVKWQSTGVFDLIDGTISANRAESVAVRSGILDNDFGGGGGMSVTNGTINIRGWNHWGRKFREYCCHL